MAKTISVPVAKMERLRDILSDWPSGREVASEAELRSLIARLLHLCEVVQPGKYFVRRMLNHVGLPPVRAWGAKFHTSHSRAASYPRIQSGHEFHTDMSFSRLLVAGGLCSSTGCFSAPLYRRYSQPPAFTLWSDASGDAMGGYFWGPSPGSVYGGALDSTPRCARLRTTVKGWNDRSTNVLELLGMVVTAWIFVTQLKIGPTYARDTVLMRGDNTSAVQ